MDHDRLALPDVGMLQGLKNYFGVVKPGIVLVNLISASGGFFLASKWEAGFYLLGLFLSGLSLVLAAGCVFNNCIDRNLDRKMVRTQNRPLADGRMPLLSAVWYGSVLALLGLVLIGIGTNYLTLAITLSGFTIYVVLYSLVLKRHSIYSTWVGSLAGAAPPLAGYCAVSHRFDGGAILLLLIFCLWQIPHWYAIALLRLDDYRSAKIPIPPLIHGIARVKKQLIINIIFFVLATLMLTFSGYTGLLTLTVVTGSGLSWVILAWAGHKTSDYRKWAMKQYVISILIILILSVMIAIDFTVPVASNPFVAYGPRDFLNHHHLAIQQTGLRQ